MEKDEWIPLKEFVYKTVRGKTVPIHIILKYNDIEFKAPNMAAFIEFLPTMIMLGKINQRNLLSGGEILVRHIEIGRIRNDDTGEQ